MAEAGFRRKHPGGPRALMMRAVHSRRNSCRACAGEQLVPFLDLGRQPLANAFLATPDDFAGEAFYPLEVCFCETCSLVQLLDVIDPEVLFRDYIYVTGTSETMGRHNAAYARTVKRPAQSRAKRSSGRGGQQRR